MNHAGEIDALTRLVRPQIAIVTTVAPVHLGFFRSVEEIADAKAEIFHGLEPGGVAIINRDSPYYERLKAHALEHGARIVGFGEAQGAEARLLGVELEPDGSEVNADILGETLSYRLGAPGRHLVQNSLAVLAAAKLAGADLEQRPPRLEGLQAQAGRGARTLIEGPGGRIAIIDESYNANPASMRAALATLGLTPRNEFTRRVAVLGDMLELGPEGPKLHQELAEFIDGAGVDVVFACGELMGSLYEALPASRQGAYAKTAEELQPKLVGRGRARGCDHGQRLVGQPHGAVGRGVEAPFRHGSRAGLDRAEGRGKAMFYWLTEFDPRARRLQRLSLHHLPHRRRADHGAAVRVPVRAQGDQVACASARAKASRSAKTAPSGISCRSRARPPWAG